MGLVYSLHIDAGFDWYLCDPKRAGQQKGLRFIRLILGFEFIKLILELIELIELHVFVSSRALCPG